MKRGLHVISGAIYEVNYNGIVLRKCDTTKADFRSDADEVFRNARTFLRIFRSGWSADYVRVARFELMGFQDALHGLRGNAFHNAVTH